MSSLTSSSSEPRFARCYRCLCFPKNTLCVFLYFACMLQVRPLIFLNLIIVITFCKQYDYTAHQCALSELRNCTSWRSLYHWSCEYLPGIVGYLYSLITPGASVVHECRTLSHKGTQHPARSLWHTEYRRVTRGSQGATRINRRTKRSSPG